MSQRDRDYDEILRRALHAAANSVEPAEDGLERIRARLTTPYPMPLAWVMAGCSQLARYAAGAPQSALAWLETVLGGVRERFRAAQPGLPPGRRPAWLRPAVAAAIAAVVVIAGALALTPLPQQAISQTAAFVRYLENGGSAGGTAAPGGSGPGAAGPAGGAVVPSPVHQHPAPPPCVVPTPALTSSAASPATSPSSTICPSPAGSPSPIATPSPIASPSPIATPSPIASPSPTVCPSPTASPSPTGSPSPTASPSPTGSLSPTGSPSPTASPSPTGVRAPRPVRARPFARVPLPVRARRSTRTRPEAPRRAWPRWQARPVQQARTLVRRSVLPPRLATPGEADETADGTRRDLP